MKSTARVMAGTLALLAMATIASPGLAQEQKSGPVGLGAEWVPMEHGQLADMRGGLALPVGASVSFGFERVVYLNGELVATARLDIPDLSRATSEQLAGLSAMSQALAVQVGAGNSFDAANGLGALVIQNTHDGQDIRAVSTLHVGVGTLGAFQNINSFGALSNALLMAPGTP